MRNKEISISCYADDAVCGSESNVEAPTHIKPSRQIKFSA